MAYSPKAIANFFIEKANGPETVSLEPMKLQKLVFFAHGWRLATSHERLISEPIQAWDYGPVVPSLYRDLKKYGSSHIPTPILDVDTSVDSGFGYVLPAVENQETRRFLDRIWDVYGRFSGPQLSELTHRPDTPWYATRQATANCRGAVISDSLMRDYFTRLAQQNAERRAVAG
jgi:uncharacterized phage-associated protein